ncbi:stage IV sporulation protein B [Halanaerobacter jeridensis]|uniref:Stage IV sporulation protein B n=1 Tax=Halanaerobacter jeridensis TaxID=706427 RepID=A0A939BNC9_9FIRM|nr:stage IV sporulation protein B [Halanaerobacter jeridensis]
MALKSNTVGKYNLDFKLFGIIPIRSMVIDVFPEVKVIPGGHSIGVILQSDGIMVVKSSFVVDSKGHKRYPALNAGLEVGDKLLKVNGVSIKNKYHLAQLIQNFGKEDEKLRFKIKKQNGVIVSKTVTPVVNKEGQYMIGIYVDDGAAGVGTISFYDPQYKSYGALGHMITEANTQLPIDIAKGEIVKAYISGIQQGKSGIPGEKLGTFFKRQGLIGDIKKNNRFGIYGQLFTGLQNPYFDQAIPVASSLEVKEGAAKIYTVINGGTVDSFDINIEEVKKQYKPAEKGLIIKITDQELLNQTGGIVQGMSGSPIVQNNKLVGVVTHVFVNDSSKGYGILAQWMLMQTKYWEQTKKTREKVS